MPATPTEELILEGTQARLATVVAGATYFYTVAASYFVRAPQIKYLSEIPDGQTLALTSPGNAVLVGTTGGCDILVNGDLLVTVAQRYGRAELPWESDYDITAVQQKLVADVLAALANFEATPGVALQPADRNFDVEVDGWAIAQVLFTYQYSQPI